MKKPLLIVFVIFLIIFGLLVVGYVSKSQILEVGQCKVGGGEWREMNNTCVDQCATGPIPSMCGMAMSDGCDCGRGSCWDGVRCVDDPIFSDEEEDAAWAELDKKLDQIHIKYK